MEVWRSQSWLRRQNSDVLRNGWGRRMQRVIRRLTCDVRDRFNSKNRQLADDRPFCTWLPPDIAPFVNEQNASIRHDLAAAYSRIANGECGVVTKVLRVNLRVFVRSSVDQ